jgi:D-xylose 1-dehydrogenase (NADP+, D-xylono-1,5-lactone-forming)
MTQTQPGKQILKWGILSTARIKRAVIPPIKSSPRHELVAIASRSLPQAEAAAREWGIPKSYGSYEALLADPHIDIIYNPLPNSLHAEWTIKACQAGKHVLCEKPLALTLAEVDAISAAAGQAGVLVAEAFMYRHHPQTRMVREMVQAGEIGQLRLVRGAFSFNISNPNDVRLSADLGGGSIWDVGCYPISFARYVIGQEPLEVFGWQQPGAGGVDETFAGQMRFAGDVFVQFDSSFRAPQRSFMEFIGSKGVLHVPVPFKPDKRESLLLEVGENIKKIPVKGQELYLGEVEDMAAVILEGKAPAISLADSRNNIAVILALLASARENRPVSLS